MEVKREHLGIKSKIHLVLYDAEGKIKDERITQEKEVKDGTKK